MESPLGPTLVNAFLLHYEKIWLEQCPQEIKLLFYRRNVDDIFVLFESQDKLTKFRDYFNGCLDVFQTLMFSVKKGSL